MAAVMTLATASLRNVGAWHRSGVKAAEIKTAATIRHVSEATYNSGAAQRLRNILFVAKT
uniref:Uncharacterized protein n=1 Tax=Leersia perrieri TaxID=77586 RepID=A0A0D9W4M3_9ORYZ